MKWPNRRRRKTIAPTGRDGAAAAAAEAPPLGAFLFADMWVEPTGMTLSVNSALARLGLDPWSEADRLTSLDRPTAAVVLSRMIARLIGRPASADTAALATRLVQLLPEAPPSRAATDDVADEAPSRHPLSPSLTMWQSGLIAALICLIAYAWLSGG